MSNCEQYSVEEIVLIEGKELNYPSSRDECKVVLSFVEYGTSEEILEKLFCCKINKETSFEIGFGKNVLLNILDSLLETMRVGSKVQYDIKFFDALIYSYGHCISFVLHLLSNKPANPIYSLTCEECIRISERYKKHGNELVTNSKTKNFCLAASFYSKGIKYLIAALTIPNVTTQQKNTCNDLKASLHLNLALCQMKLNFHPEVITNCSKSLEIKQENSKAIYRRATSYLALNDYENAERDIKILLELDSKNTSFVSLMSQWKQKKSTFDSQLGSRLRSMFR